MTQLENIEAIEKRLWNAADNLRANSNYASNEYFMPVMGLIFLRHAYSRFLAEEFDLPATERPVRLSGVAAQRSGPGGRHHQGDGIHRRGLCHAQGCAPQSRVSGVG